MKLRAGEVETYVWEAHVPDPDSNIEKNDSPDYPIFEVDDAWGRSYLEAKALYEKLSKELCVIIHPATIEAKKAQEEGEARKRYEVLRERFEKGSES